MRKNSVAVLSLGLACGFAGHAMAAVDLQVTEIYTGIPSTDGTADWFELTNFGDTAVDTADYAFDDSHAAYPGVNLDSFVLGANESAIFLISGLSTDVDDFNAVWGAGLRVGLTNGGHNLGQAGDQVNIFLAADLSIIETVDLNQTGDVLATVEVYSNTPAWSVEGLRGAHLSNSFANTELGMVQLVGSPGTVVPEPATLMLLAMGGLSMLRRRR